MPMHCPFVAINLLAAARPWKPKLPIFIKLCANKDSSFDVQLTNSFLQFRFRLIPLIQFELTSLQMFWFEPFNRLSD